MSAEIPPDSDFGLDSTSQGDSTPEDEEASSESFGLPGWITGIVIGVLIAAVIRWFFDGPAHFGALFFIVSAIGSLILARWVFFKLGGVSGKGTLTGIAGFLLGGMLTGYFSLPTDDGSSVRDSPVDVGQPMSIAGPTVHGATFDLAEHRGKVVLVDFWATWCGPCLAEMPNVRAVYDRYHDSGLEVVGVSLDDDRDTLVDFLETHPESWPQVFFDEDGSRGFNNPLAKKYQVNTIPRLMVIDREGNLAAQGVRGHEIEVEVTKALDLPIPLGTRLAIVTRQSLVMLLRGLDGRWLAVPKGLNVLLVDLEFKSTPLEKEYRQRKSMIDPVWHNTQADAAEGENNWFAAAFHRAWGLKAEPSSPDAYFGLQFATDKLDKTQQLNPHILKFIRAMAQLATELPQPEMSRNYANRVNARVWERVSDASGVPLSDAELTHMVDVCAKFPRAEFLNTLGVARYRARQFEAAIESLNESVKRTPTQWKPPLAADLAFLAMSHFQLGNFDEANQFRAELNKKPKTPALLSLFAEVDRLFASAKRSPDDEN